MLDIGWSELILIGVVALIVVGPRDLPDMFRTMGRFTAKARGMARDFSRAMEDAARETGVEDVARDLREATSSRGLGLDAVKTAASKFEQWDPLKAAKQGLTPNPVAAATPAALASAPAAAAEVAAPARELGPATQAQADAKAQKAAIAREAAEKLRSVADATPAEAPPAKPAAKPKAKKAASPKQAAEKVAKASGAKPKAAEPAEPVRARGRRRTKPDEQA